MSKDILRKKAFEIRNKLSHDEIDKRSLALMEKVKNMDVFKNSKTILVYVGFDKEINTHQFIKDCIELGKEVISPICVYKDRTLILGKTTSFPEEFITTKYGILELDKDKCEHVDIQEIDLVLMPGLAFAANGDRLGYGAGYYDKMLENKSPKTITLAPVFDEFIFEEVPTDDHDVKIDYIVTESNIYHTV